MIDFGTLEPAELLGERTARVDRAVGEAAAEVLAAAPAGFALLAVGGYGRGDLFPHSDIDLLLLFESELLASECREPISVFLRRLWDCGMRVSQSVRTPGECLEVHDQNTELNISLIDRRFLVGDGVLYQKVESRLPRFLQSQREALIRNLAKLTKARHAKYADTFYHLEPNVKETPGGLRDYNLICWLDRLRGVADAERGDALSAAFRHMSRIRYWLHEQAGRDQNVLNFDAQEEMAEQWMRRQSEHRGEPSDSAAAHWMRGYFRHAREIYKAATTSLEEAEAQYSGLFAQFRDWRSRLGNADFSVRRERVQFRESHMVGSDPELAMRFFEFVARHGIQPSTEAARSLQAQAGAFTTYFSQSRPIWPVLNRIFALPHAPLALRAMHDTGVLTAIFPELRKIECLVVRDFYHRYTVDEHTLVAIEKIWRAEGGFGEVLAEASHIAALVFATLFHDAGKGMGGGHVDGSLKLAECAMRRIQMPARDQEDALFLIRKHLDLSAAMQSRDVTDPQTVRDLAGEMGTVELLKALTLLTYADISAVNPTAMTPWRAEQLWQLYLSVYNELTRELETDRIQQAPSASPEMKAFIEGFPKRYLRTHTEKEIEEHMLLETRSHKRGVAVEIQRTDAAWQMTLVAGDHPGLFAGAAGTLAGFGMNILRAEAFSNRRGIVLDTFTFADPLRTLELNPTEVDRLRTTAERVISGRMSVADLLRNRPKPSLPSRKASVPATVSFDSQASQTATLVEITTQDRPGLLYDLASAMSGQDVNIEVVLIDTEAHKAIDVFYVTSAGKKLEAEKQKMLGEALRNVAS